MKKQFFPIIAIVSVGIGFTSCASYNAVALNNLNHVIKISEQQKDVTITAKAFSKEDCKKFLDRDVIAAGYQPVQLYIQNNSDNPVVFSVNKVSLPCATTREVAEKVHTSTVGRSVGYGVGALFIWPLAIPAIVDGIKSSDANKALDADFAHKAVSEETIFPKSHFNKLIFVPNEAYSSTFYVALTDATTQKPQEWLIHSN